MVSKNPWLLLVFVLVPISIIALRRAPASPLSELPPVIIWAWERPERLDFINTNQVGVAFLAKTVRLEDDRVVSKPRLQPLELAHGSKVIAVVRIESVHPSLSKTQLQDAVYEITQVSYLRGLSVVQIDFDATVSERGFYRELLTSLRSKISSEIPISITALASWCAGDNWLADLPIDEAVPMFFRMGLDKHNFQSGRAITTPICKNAAGVSTDEPFTPPDVDRLYIFSPEPWSRNSLNSALEKYKR